MKFFWDSMKKTFKSWFIYLRLFKSIIYQMHISHILTGLRQSFYVITGHDITGIITTEVPMIQSLIDKLIIIDHGRQPITLMIGVQCVRQPTPVTAKPWTTSKTHYNHQIKYIYIYIYPTQTTNTSTTENIYMYTLGKLRKMFSELVSSLVICFWFITCSVSLSVVLLLKYLFVIVLFHCIKPAHHHFRMSMCRNNITKLLKIFQRLYSGWYSYDHDTQLQTPDQHQE